MQIFNKIKRSDYDEFVSIGSCCESSFIIQINELSFTSYPFDWCLIDSVNDLSKIIDHDCQEFTNLTPKLNKRWMKTMPSLNNLGVYIPHFDGNHKSLAAKIKNLQNLCKTQKKVLFIWKGHIGMTPSVIEMETLIDAIRKKAPLLFFDILLVNEYLPTDNIICNYPTCCRVANTLVIQ